MAGFFLRRTTRRKRELLKCLSCGQPLGYILGPRAIVVGEPAILIPADGGTISANMGGKDYYHSTGRKLYLTDSRPVDQKGPGVVIRRRQMIQCRACKFCWEWCPGREWKREDKGDSAK